MFKGAISNVTATANTNIPITQEINSNRNISYDSTNNTIIFNTPGYYDVVINIVTTNVAAGDISLTEYINGVASTTSVSTSTSASTTDAIPLVINDVIHVIPAMLGNNANVSYRLSVPATIVNGIVLVEGRK